MIPYKSPLRSSLQKLADSFGVTWFSRPDDDVAGDIAAKAAGGNTDLEQYKNPINVRKFKSSSGQTIGCVGNGVADDGPVLQEALKRGEIENRPVYLPAGSYLTKQRLTAGDPATESYRAQSNQGVGCSTVYGEGGFFGARIVAGPGCATSVGEYLLSRRNLSGIVYDGLTLDGSDYAQNVLDLSWLGGSQGDPNVAPSNRNQLRNVWIDGGAQVKVGVNLDQFHDSELSSLHIRCGSIASLYARGPGGTITLHQVWATGPVYSSAQNGGASQCGFYGGVYLQDPTYNQWHFDTCHFYSGSFGYSLFSASTGNGTRAVLFTACQFNETAGMLAHIGGAFHSGVIAEICTFICSAPEKIYADFPVVNGARAKFYARDSYFSPGLPPAAYASEWELIDCTTGPHGLLRARFSNVPMLVADLQGRTGKVGPAFAQLDSPLADSLLIVSGGGKNATLTPGQIHLEGAGVEVFTLADNARARLDGHGVQLDNPSNAQFSNMLAPYEVFLQGTGVNNWSPIPLPGGNHNGAVLIFAVTRNPGPKAIFSVTKPTFSDANEVLQILSTSKSADNKVEIQLRWRNALDTSLGPATPFPEVRCYNADGSISGAVWPYPITLLVMGGFGAG